MNKETIKRVISDQRELIKRIKINDRDVILDPQVNYILTGIRRAGKSWLLYKRVKDLIKTGVDWNQIIYINFDDDRLKNFKFENFDDILVIANELTNKTKYFYFDEIQNVDGWEQFARRMADQKFKVDITGSNAKMLSSEMNAKLGGRYISKEIMPYSFKEYLGAKKFDLYDTSTKNYALLLNYTKEYLKYGGFPECINFQDKREYVSSVYSKTFLGDIVMHNKIRNIKGAEMLFVKIAETICNDVSYSRLHNCLVNAGVSVSKDMVIDYCQYAQDAFLIFKLKNYFESFSNKESTPKYYFIDGGLLNLFVDDKESKLLENAVACNLFRLYRDDLFFINSSKTSINIDFYLPKHKQAIQVCWELNDDSTNREVESLLKLSNQIKDNNWSYTIITMSQQNTIKKNNVLINVVPIDKWLVDINFKK